MYNMNINEKCDINEYCNVRQPEWWQWEEYVMVSPCCPKEVLQKAIWRLKLWQSFIQLLFLQETSIIKLAQCTHTHAQTFIHWVYLSSQVHWSSTSCHGITLCCDIITHSKCVSRMRRQNTLMNTLMLFSTETINGFVQQEQKVCGQVYRRQ